MQQHGFLTKLILQTGLAKTPQQAKVYLYGLLAAIIITTVYLWLPSNSDSTLELSPEEIWPEGAI